VANHAQLSVAKKSDGPSLGAVLRWLASRTSPQESTGRQRRAPAKMPRLGVVRRSRLGAWWEARSAVGAGVCLGEFLRWRLARYLGRLPVAAAELRAALTMEDGLQEDAAPSLLAACLAEVGADRLRVRTDSEVALAKQDVASAEAELARIQARLEAQATLVENCEHDLEAAVADGSAAIRAAEWATPEQLGRPPVPRPWALAFCCVLAASLMVAEVLLLTGPFLRMSGLEPELARELVARPLEAAPCLLLALGAAAALLVLARFVLREGSELLATGERRRSGWAVGAIVAVGAAAVWTLSSASSARSFTVLGLLMPFAAIWLLEYAERLVAARVPLVEKARAWDQEFRIAMAERIRHEELVERACEERDRLAREREAIQAELALAIRRALEAERGYAATSSAERSRLSRLANSLNAALERDRYAFIYEAARSGARELLVDAPPRWAPPSLEPPRGARTPAAQSAVA
jgi:hypothetical protein